MRYFIAESGFYGSLTIYGLVIALALYLQILLLNV